MSMASASHKAAQIALQSAANLQLHVRDSHLYLMAGDRKVVSEATRESLRRSSLGLEFLFGEEEVTQAIQAKQDETKEKVFERSLNAPRSPRRQVTLGAGRARSPLRGQAEPQGGQRTFSRDTSQQPQRGGQGHRGKKDKKKRKHHRHDNRGGSGRGGRKGDRGQGGGKMPYYPPK